MNIEIAPALQGPVPSPELILMKWLGGKCYQQPVFIVPLSTLLPSIIKSLILNTDDLCYSWYPADGPSLSPANTVL